MSLPRPKTSLIKIITENNLSGDLKVASSDHRLGKTQSFQRGLTLNLSLDNFKSPLQSFSL